jgi:hypothetical protein
MDLIYNIFYEVLYEQGIWVLILIASAFAVASFILLTLRMETNPRQSNINQVGKQLKDDTKTSKEEGTSPELNKDLPPPDMTAPGGLVPPEVVLPGAAPYKNIPQPVTEPAPQPAPGQIIDPFDVAPLTDEGKAISTGTEATPSSAADQTPISAAGLGSENAADVISIRAAGMPEGEGLIVPQKSKEELEELKEESEGELEEKPGDGNIMNLFEEVDEENTEFAEFAKALDDVALPGLLTETENLSQELKDILTKHGRRH